MCKSNRYLLYGGLLLLAVVLSSGSTSCQGKATVEVEEPTIGSTMPWLDGSTLVFIPGGDFLMGQDSEIPADYAPAHTVAVTDFWVQNAEVTNGMYAQCVAAGVCSPPQQEPEDPNPYDIEELRDYPVSSVDWTQASVYCSWIQGSLLSEAQWEKMGRGSEGAIFPWGDEEPTCDLADFTGCLSPDGPSQILSYPLGYSAYETGDTAGNVFEWVADWYAEDYYPSSPVEDPTGPASGITRVVRGSSYLSALDQLPIYLRTSLDPEQYSSDLGFRCTITSDVAYAPPPSMCESLAFFPPSEEVEAITPIVTPIDVKAYGRCTWNDEGDDTGMVNLTFTETVSPEDYCVTSSASGWTYVYQDAGYPNVLIVYGPGIPPDSTISLTVCDCSPVEIPDVSPECPSGYEISEADGLCHRSGASALLGECDSAHHLVEGYGCMPLAKGSYPFCPPGYSKFVKDGLTVCLPYGGPAACVGNSDCSPNQTCPVGTYDTESDCCMVESGFLPSCSPGYEYSEAKLACIPTSTPTSCTTMSVYIPPCKIETEFSACSSFSEFDCPMTYCKLQAGPTGNKCVPR